MNFFGLNPSSKNFRDWAVILVLFALVTFSVDLNGRLLMSSVNDTPKHDPFDGTVMPIQYIPDWVNTSSEEQDKNYHEFPSSKLIELPEYDNDKLTIPYEDLEWGNSSHDLIRNMQITYTVAYTDNYEWDQSGQGTGSHPAVDMVTISGTPVFAVANAVVKKAVFSNSGFGNHIVLEHQDAPDPKNRGRETDLFSSYSHLSKIFISEGDVIRKGQVIGEVGDTGTATVAHLHFQLDDKSAPFMPYWPFDSADTTAAGLNFWEGVNAKLGYDNVLKYTHNPLMWVQEHLDGSSVDEVVINEPEPEFEEETDDVEEEETIEANEVTEEEEEENLNSVVASHFDDIKTSLESFIILGNNSTVKIELLDENGSRISNPEFDGRIEVSLSDESLGKLSRDFLEPEDFKNGKAELYLYADREGEVNLNFRHASKHFDSNYISFISKVNPFARLGIEVDGEFTPGTVESIIIKALDADGNLTPSFSAAGKIELSTIQGEGSFSPSVLSSSDFINGVVEVDFVGEGTEDVIIQTQYGQAKSESKLMRVSLFTDLGRGHENYSAISYLFRQGTISGYPDGTYQANKPVSRAEATKLVFSGTNQKLNENLRLSFPDTEDGQWYSPYVATAQSRNIVVGYEDGEFKPLREVSNAEIIKILLSTVDVKIDMNVETAPYSDVDVDDWFAPYVQFAKEKNLFPSEGSRFYPSNPANRAIVAEVIYRLVMMQEAGAASTLR